MKNTDLYTNPTRGLLPISEDKKKTFVFHSCWLAQLATMINNPRLPEDAKPTAQDICDIVIYCANYQITGGIPPFPDGMSAMAMGYCLGITDQLDHDFTKAKSRTKSGSKGAAARWAKDDAPDDDQGESKTSKTVSAKSKGRRRKAAEDDAYTATSKQAVLDFAQTYCNSVGIEWDTAMREQAERFCTYSYRQHPDWEPELTKWLQEENERRELRRIGK